MELKQNMFLRQGSYRIEKVLGQGGFGITYLAEQVLLGRKVAIKEFFMKEHCNRDANTFSVSVPSVGSRETVERFRQKFLKEARTIASFVSSNIVNVIDVFEENGTAYYVMEYLDGKSLGAIVAECGALDEALAVRYICQVADALMEVHGKNLLHLDIKPANVMLDSKGNAVLIDFGISKHYDDEGSQTSSGLIGISDGYAPMEQYKKGGLDSFTPATDIYALGAMLFKLVTSVTPPHASDINDDGLPALPDSISPAVRSAIKSAMQPRRKDRPQSIEEFLGKLKEQRAKSKDASFDNTSSNSSSTHRGEVSRSDGGENDLPTEKIEYAKNYTATPDDEETQVGMNPPLPSATPPFEKAGELSNGVNDDDETLLNSSSTPRGEVSRSDGGESELKTENGKSKLPLIIIILLLSIILGAGGYLLFSGGSDGNSSNNDSSYAAEKQALLEREAQAEERERIAAEQAAAEEQARLEREAEEKRAREEAERIDREKQQGISTQQKVDLGLSVKWAGWNVGASFPEEYGNYYAWGETTTKTSYTDENCSTNNKSIGSIAGKSTYDVARARWGGSWRLPTKEEFEELIDRCTWTWITYKGVNGYKVTGPNGNSIFLPAAGLFRASLYDRGTFGDYWSATPNESYSNLACYLGLFSGHYVADWNYRGDGLSVRPVSE